MTAQNFENVFQKLSLSMGIQEAFSGTEVRRLTIHKKERSVSMEISAKELIPLQKREDLRQELLKSLPGIREVEIDITYELSEKSIDELASGYWDSIKTFVSQQSKVCAGVISDAEWEIKDGKMLIYVKNNMAYYLAQKHLDDMLMHMISEETGRNLMIQFKNVQTTAEERAFREQKQEQRLMELSQKIVSTQTEAVQEKANAEVAAVSSAVSKGILLGKEINGNPVKVIDTKIEGEAVIIEGSIYNVETKEIKGEKYIVSFDITDLSDSTTVKFFVKKSVFDQELSDKIKKGKYLRVQGDVQFDKYSKEINIMAKNIMTASAPAPRMDDSEEKRVELHLHTQMSSMDGVTHIKKYIQRAIDWGHKAIAITDHGVVQAFPDAMNAVGKADLKVIYGVEAYLIDDLGSVVTMPRGQSLDDTFVVFDIETTGLSRETENITEIGAVKLQDGKIVDRFSTFVNPEKPISDEITKLTGITDEMVADAPVIQDILPEFLSFCGDAVLVAHNANFDMGFIRVNAERKCGIEVKNTVLDTLELSRSLLPELNKHKLNLVCDHLGVSLEGHHRAVNDAEATAEVFQKFIDMLVDKKIYHVDDINVFSSQTVNY
ncbi:MAG: PHP domain-containing protein, partial [Anaerotignum sp.]|nr:PHP domain-containing protein [Anaerotignum sp.]